MRSARDELWCPCGRLLPPGRRYCNRRCRRFARWILEGRRIDAELDKLRVTLLPPTPPTMGTKGRVERAREAISTWQEDCPLKRRRGTMTQGEAAMLVGISRWTWTGWESGTGISGDALVRLEERWPGITKELERWRAALPEV